MVGILIFASIAAIIFYKLWSVLGKRPEGAKPSNVVPFTVITDRSKATKTPAAPVEQNQAAALDPRYARIVGGLTAIRTIDPEFDPDSFVAGARQAFHLIVKAFADGDTVTLRSLLSDPVYDSFASLIKARLAAGDYMDCRITNLEEPDLIDAGADGTLAHLTVRFSSTQISFTRNKDGQLLDGSPETPQDHTDEWVFARDLTSSNPNWLLVATTAD